MMMVAFVIVVSVNGSILARDTIHRNGTWTSNTGTSSQDGDAQNIQDGGNTISFHCAPSSLCCFIIGSGGVDINPLVNAQNEYPPSVINQTVLTRSSSINNFKDDLELIVDKNKDKK